MCTNCFNFQAELGKPNPFYPDKGKVSIYVDCSPTAEPAFEVYEVYTLCVLCAYIHDANSLYPYIYIYIYISAINIHLCPPMNYSRAVNAVCLKLQGRGGEELSAELSSALQRCLLGGKSGAGAFLNTRSIFHEVFMPSESCYLQLTSAIYELRCRSWYRSLISIHC